MTRFGTDTLPSWITFNLGLGTNGARASRYSRAIAIRSSQRPSPMTHHDSRQRRQPHPSSIPSLFDFGESFFDGATGANNTAMGCSTRRKICKRLARLKTRLSTWCRSGQAFRCLRRSRATSLILARACWRLLLRRRRQ